MNVCAYTKLCVSVMSYNVSSYFPCLDSGSVVVEGGGAVAAE